MLRVFFLSAFFLFLFSCTSTNQHDVSHNQSRKKILITGEFANYEDYSSIKHIYINERLLVPFPKNLRTASRLWTIAKFPLSESGSFSGEVYVCGPISGSIYGYFTKEYKLDQGEIFIKFDVDTASPIIVEDTKKDGSIISSRIIPFGDIFKERLENGTDDFLEERKYNRFLSQASNYETLEEIPCYLDFD